MNCGRISKNRSQWVKSKRGLKTSRDNFTYVPETEGLCDFGVVKPKSPWGSSVQDELIGSGPLRSLAFMPLLGLAHCLVAPDRKGQKHLQRHWTSELNIVTPCRTCRQQFLKEE